MMAQGLGPNLASRLSDVTLEKCADVGLAYAQDNRHVPGQSIRKLSEAFQERSLDSAIVMAAGPSLHRNNVAEQIKASGFEGLIISSESAMAYCFRNGLVPDVIVTLDPHSKRIVRFFGDPDLTAGDLEADDYFRRQDLDPALRENELKRNQDLLEAVDAHGPTIRAAVASCASPPVVQRCRDSGMDIYWWNPLYDDPMEPESVTRQVYDINGYPCVNAGGNVGTACWVLAHSILEIQKIALVGMDLSYYEDTDHINTQYYYELVDLVGEDRVAEAFIDIENPYLGKTWFTDPTYYWYRDVFLEMAADAPCITYNCTEGGILFGDGVVFTTLAKFLSNH
ncbi:MAG TPA: hypothetical protein DHW45_02465 [Candidatus Latescibacteria bacterium]|nr:hypothetical protein [Candidatus Latescibacterota bacterium]